MGEYEQPVVGMKSCFDYSEMEGFGEARGILVGIAIGILKRILIALC